MTMQMYFESCKYMFLRRSRNISTYIICRYISGSCPPPPNTKKLATLLVEDQQFSALERFNNMRDILWKSYAPENILNTLGCTQIADSLRTAISYIFRDKISVKYVDNYFLYLGQSQVIWFNRNIKSKSKQSFFYEDWFKKEIVFF